MNTLGDVIAETQGLLGDPDGEWVTRDYIVPFIGTTYRLQYLAIKSGARGRNLEQVIEVPAVPAGTASLYPQANVAKQPLQGLTDPLEVWWKPAGQPPAAYRFGFPRGTLPFAVQTTLLSLYWTWLGNKLLMTPMTIPIDILLDGRFNPPPLIDDEQILVVSTDMQSPLSLGSAALAGVERANPTLMEGYSAAADIGINNIIADLLCQKQKFPKRLGRQAPNPGWRWAR